MEGCRVYPNEDGWLPRLMPGDYGRCTAAVLKPTSSLRWWQVCCPDGSLGSLNPEVHQVLEHEDGTITVTPSIDCSGRLSTPNAFHGYLKAGHWSRA